METGRSYTNNEMHTTFQLANITRCWNSADLPADDKENL